MQRHSTFSRARNTPVLVTLYRAFFSFLFLLVDRRLKSVPRLKWELHSRFDSTLRPIWIHAASAGELEGLKTVALELARQQIPIFMTVFSPSAERPFLKLKEQLQALGGWLGGGLSPTEGAWLEVFEAIQPRAFVTAKYEAWPDLWLSAAQVRVPIVIVGAQLRFSIRMAKWISTVLSPSSQPSLELLYFNDDHEKDLKDWSKRSDQVKKVRDPRWDALVDFANGRSAGDRLKSERWEQILARLAPLELPRPWTVLGNLWTSDIKRLPALLSPGAEPSTLWVVPHQVSGREVERQLELIGSRGWRVIRTSQIEQMKDLKRLSGSHQTCIFVDELGVLKSLYFEADQVYVGGGFGQGVHNVMEPSVAGAPILIGPKGADRFAEVLELTKEGQVSLVLGESDLHTIWSLIRSKIVSPESRQRALEKLRSRAGGTQDVTVEILRH